MIWREELKIGVDEIDNQHQELFNRLNEFLKVVRNKDESQSTKKEKVRDTLAFLEEYVAVHFSAEEKIQLKNNYPNFEEHHQIHEEFKEEIADFRQKFSGGNYDEELLMEFSGHLLTWLINHVANEDQKIADYINNQS
ncbi:MAG: bacteriohemerythrin [Bacillota bacterium]